MKKTYSFLVLFLICNMMYSQVLIALLLGDKLNTGKIEFGLDGGVDFNTISNMDSNSWDRDWNLGFYFDIKMKDQWYISTGVLVKANLGIYDLTTTDLANLNATTYDEYDGTYTQKIGYFIVPVLAKYRFKNNMYAEIGPQAGLRNKAYIQFVSTDGDLNVNIKQDNKDLVNRFDFGFTAGAGYRLLKGLGWTIGARYYYGVTNVYKDTPGKRNSALFLRMNVPIGLSQDKKDEIKEMKGVNHEKKVEKKAARKAAYAEEHPEKAAKQEAKKEAKKAKQEAKKAKQEAKKAKQEVKDPTTEAKS